MNSTTVPRQPASRARFFLVMPPQALHEHATSCLEAFCAQADAASLLLPELSEDSEDRARQLTQHAQALGLAVLVQDDARLMQRLGADGVHLQTENARKIATLRKKVGTDVIIGACCPGKRHAAMELGEAGADYLAIDQRIEARGENLLAWWALMFTVPAVAIVPVSPVECTDILGLGADFIVPLQQMWQGEEQAARLAAEYRVRQEEIAHGQGGGLMSS